MSPTTNNTKAAATTKDDKEEQKLVPVSAVAATTKAKKPVNKYKKSPNAPKRFKSAFIFYSATKHPEIRQRLKEKGIHEKTTNIAKRVAENWKNLTPDERSEWETKANQDKERFEAEKATYTGPWTVLSSGSGSSSKRAKDPDAPKRPMSAFLAYSNSRRAGLKRKHPNLTNAELSRTLSKRWKELPEDERQKYKDEEFELRQKYKVAMAEWRSKVEEREQEAESQRQQQQEELKQLHQELAKANAAAAAAADLNSLRHVHHVQREQQLAHHQQQQQHQLLGGAMNNLFGAGGNSAAVSAAASAMVGMNNPFLATAGMPGTGLNPMPGNLQYPFTSSLAAGAATAGSGGAGDYGLPSAFLAGGAATGTAAVGAHTPTSYESALLAAAMQQQNQQQGPAFGSNYNGFKPHF